jgi:class 3 adenylate cyclase
VSCPSCGKSQRDDARFCDQCGRPLAGASPREPRAYTPRHLAERILTTRSALEGERKQVTVLFADIEGSTELSQEIGPETWHRLLDAYFRILADGVHRYEGTINQYTGDGIMALFGAPVAHEDHAERACHAALELSRALARFSDAQLDRSGVRVAVRIGLNSGEVVVGKIGDDLRMDYTAQGHTVALAARMQELAPAGSVCLSEHTARAVEGFFELRDLGESVPKGFAAPVRAYRLDAQGPLRTRLDRSRARGLTRLVGRSRELALLESALERALAGDGQAIAIVGDAGVGKSRLAYEFVERCRGDGIAVAEAHCPPHGRALPLLAIGELLRSHFDVAGDDAPGAARERIARRLLALSPAFEDALPALFDALALREEPGAPATPEAEARERLAPFLRRWVQAASADAPLVLLLDDLHWVDAPSDALVAELVEAMGFTRTLLVANYRPDYPAPWLRGSYCRALPLAPLDGDERRDLLRALLGEDASLAALAGRIEQQASGNPFFMEEAVRAAVASGRLEGAPGAYRLARAADGLEVPDTVQAVIASRIDRLDAREKELLLGAAVIGARFAPALLEAALGFAEPELGAVLAALGARELLVPADSDYVFAHPLVQEVAYASQLSATRQELHARVARALEALHRERLGEKAGWIAHHWQAAGAELEAARWRQRASLRVSRIEPRRRRDGRGSGRS